MRAFIRKAGVYLWHTTVCVAVLAWVMTAFWVFSYLQSIHHRHQAERLLQELKALPQGAADSSRVQKIAKAYGGEAHCTQDGCTYDFDSRFWFTESGPALLLRRTEWDYVGLRPWRVTARIQQRNNRLTTVEFDTLVGCGRGWLYNDGLFSGNKWAWWSVFVMVNSERFEQTAQLEQEYAREAAGKHALPAGADGIIVRKPSLTIDGGGEALVVYISPAATPASKAVGLDINLRCATAMSPCTELCQLTPSAWRSYSAFQRGNGWAIDQPADCSAR